MALLPLVSIPTRLGLEIFWLNFKYCECNKDHLPFIQNKGEPENEYSDSRWYVDDGCHSETRTTNDYPGSYELDSFLAGVRCCSTTDSSTTCTTIGKCPTDAVTHSEAETMCKDIGMELCTKYDLFTEVCCGTGGNCDSHQVWTSTKEIGLFIFMMLISECSLNYFK